MENNFVQFLFRFLQKNETTFSQFYLNFNLILSQFYPNSIWIQSRYEFVKGTWTGLMPFFHTNKLLLRKHIRTLRLFYIMYKVSRCIQNLGLFPIKKTYYSRIVCLVLWWCKINAVLPSWKKQPHFSFESFLRPLKWLLGRLWRVSFNTKFIFSEKAINF